MAISIGPRNYLDQGLRLAVDFSNRKSYSPNIMNYSVWSLGSNSISASSSAYGISGYTNNPTDAENLRELQTDPFGFTQAVVWNARTIDGVTQSGDNDGGWNSDLWPADNSKMYRFSVWGKRYPDTTYTAGSPVHPTNASGTLYFGFYGALASGGLTDSVTIDGLSRTANPYFHTAASPPGLGGSDVWTLIVGHVWPYSAATGSLVPGSNISNTALPLSYHHPDSGYWTRGASPGPGSKVGNNTYQDRVWNPSTKALRHRAYLFYGATGGCTASFVYPRVDIVDGFEPSISELLTGVEPVRNLAGPGTAYAKHHTNYSASFNGCMIMERTKFMGFSGTMSDAFTVNAASVWIRPDSTITGASTGQAIFQLGAGTGLILGLGDVAGAVDGESIFLGGEFGNTSVQNVSMQGGQWHNITVNWETSSYAIYLNGEKQTTTSGSAANQTLFSTNGRAVIGGRFATNGSPDLSFDGRLSSVMVWSRSLSAADIATLVSIGREKFK